MTAEETLLQLGQMLLFDADEFATPAATDVAAKPLQLSAENAGGWVGASWRGFAPIDERGKPVTDNAIRAAFDAIYHAKPAEIRRGPSVILAGPVTP